MTAVDETTRQSIADAIIGNVSGADAHLVGTAGGPSLDGVAEAVDEIATVFDRLAAAHNALHSAVAEARSLLGPRPPYGALLAAHALDKALKEIPPWP